MEAIYRTIEQLRSTNSPKNKAAILEVCADPATLQQILKLAYDPFITFGITEITDLGNGSNQEFPFSLMEALAERKLTGNNAKLVLAEYCRGNSRLRDLVTMVLNKDLKCGIGPKTVLDAFPGLIRQFETMRAHKYDDNKDKVRFPVAVEPKLDGLRCIVFVSDDVRFYSRGGREFTAIDHLKPTFLEFGSNLIFDGELIAGSNFNDSVSSVKRKEASEVKAVFNAFEVFNLEDWGKSQATYDCRRLELSRFPDSEFFKKVPSMECHSHDEIMVRYREARNRGYEGLIVKSLVGKYWFKRHRDWLKIKDVNDLDLEICSLEGGEPGSKYEGMLGALVVRYGDKTVNVGSGFSDEQRKDFWDRRFDMLGKIAEVQYHEVTPDGSLRHPRFIKIREDLH